jgi:16S rRNA (guanine527-N7)-methyltransferase
LTHFEQRFRAWNGRINLVASSTLNDLWARHIVDSAQLFALRPKALTWGDLGSGGGFPGLIIAILFEAGGSRRYPFDREQSQKAAFLQAMVGELDLPARIYAGRIEDV